MENTTGVDNPVEQVSTLNKSWEEIRADCLSTPYGVFAEAALERIHIWEAAPRASLSVEDWTRDTDEQITKAKAIPGNTHYETTNIGDTTVKIFAHGKEVPETGKGVLTRIYIGLDPRRVTDAFVALLEQLDKNGSLKDIDIALNMESLQERKANGEMIVIYDPLSRPDVLNSVLGAYREASIAHPELFELSPHQKARIMRGVVQGFKAIIDANMSFVEMAPEDGSASYDAAVVNQIFHNFGIDKTRLPSDSQWLQKIKEGGKNRVVYTNVDRARYEKGELRKGDSVSFKRKLSAPALIQTGSFTVK